MRPQAVLIVDDEPDIRRVVSDILRDEGFRVEAAENADIARQKYKSLVPDLILLDIWMPDTDGVTLLREWKTQGNVPPIVMISGHGTVETAIESVRAGAYDFLEKPLSTAKLLVTVERALESRHLRYENLLLRNRLEPTSTLTGHSQIIGDLRDQVRQIGSNDNSVLIMGERGSGKSVVARALHRASPRSDSPFIEMRLSSMSPDETFFNLFGREDNGIFRIGALEEANNGTLVFDEISELSQIAQDQLSSAIRNNQFSRPDTNQIVSLNVRFIATTNRDLEKKVADGSFLNDLYQQFARTSIFVPPLREHREDIPELVDYYARIITDSERLPFRKFSTAAVNLIRNRNWLGNVRELRDTIQRLLLSAQTEEIDLDQTKVMLENVYEYEANEYLHPTISYSQPLRKAREEFEKGYFLHHLELVSGNMTKLANRSGMERTHLYRKLKSLGIDPKAVKDKR